MRETAERIGAPSPVYTQNLREIDVGDWTGASVDDLIAHDGAAYVGWRAGTHVPPGGESWRDFVSRVSGVIADQRSEAANGTLLVVCHGGVIRALLQHLLGILPAHVIPVAPASLTLLRLDGTDGQSAQLELFNYLPGALDFEAPD